jgi:hypothetical protein
LDQLTTSTPSAGDVIIDGEVAQDDVEMEQIISEVKTIEIPRPK